MNIVKAGALKEVWRLVGMDYFKVTLGIMVSVAITLILKYYA